jgi:cytochrome c2
LFQSYSGALKAKGGKWNDKTLDKWLKSPADYAPGKFLFSYIFCQKNKNVTTKSDLLKIQLNESKHI